MRYYRIVISDPATKEILVPNYNGTPGFSRAPFDPNLSTYTTLYPNMLPTTPGSTNPAAQRVVLDLPTTYYHIPGQNSFIRVYGVGLSEIGQASNLNNLNIQVYGGMAAGLPLANPNQSGLLTEGQIFQAFGNWINTEMTLDIYLYYAGSSPSSDQTTGVPNSSINHVLPSTIDNPANIVFQWQPGQPLLTPLTNCLQQAFPQYSIKGAVSPNLVWVGAPANGFFSTLRQFAVYLNQKSQSMVSGYAPSGIPGSPTYYQGVCLALQGGTISVSDGTTTLTPKAISFFDLIGQPTWSQPFHVQVTCIMRSDIQVGDYVTLPPGLGTISSGAQSQYFNPQQSNTYSQNRQQSVFSGTFQVINSRHIGDHRSPDAQGWLTVLDLLNISTPATVVDSYPVLYTGQTQ